MSTPKVRIAVIYGGRSGEHEVSLRSAASVVKNLDRNRFEVIPVAIDREGRWHVNNLAAIDAAASDMLPVVTTAADVFLPPNPAQGSSLIQMGGGTQKLDVVFPVMHGPLCEDGTIQGLLELADVPYVGCGVLASAVCMDKDIAKRLVHAAGLPIAPYIAVKKDEWESQREKISARVKSELGYPVFVKPANMGSSVGVHKVKEAASLDAAVRDSLLYDTKILIELAVNAREIEVSVLENAAASAEPLTSVPGEISPTHEFYSYESKYLDDNGATLKIPARLTPEQVREAQRIAREAFVALECEGLGRVDMFLDRDSGKFYFNEVNTLPGFTSISMYPKMWEASGVSYSDLLSKLIELAIFRHRKKSALKRER